MSMESFKPFNPLEISGETPEDISGLKKINEAIIPRKEAPLIPPGGEADVTERGAREKVFAAFSGEVAVSYENNEDRKRRELELSARNFFAKMSTENLLRKPTKEVGVSYNPDKKFEGLEPTTKATFQTEEIPEATFSEEVYDINGEVHARIAMMSGDGKKLYLDNLLPQDVRLVPSDLVGTLSSEGGGVKITEYKMKDRDGIRDSGGFAYVHMGDGSRWVKYDTLKSKEGMAALFHEMGHAWNDEAGLAGTKIEMNSFRSQLKFFWNEMSGNFFGTAATLRENRQEDMLENRISDERDAWAHGFGMMRFLKSRGFPLHIAQTPGALKGIAEGCLATYQKFHAGNIEKFGLRRFTSGAKESPGEIAEREREEEEARALLEKELDALFGDEDQ